MSGTKKKYGDAELMLYADGEMTPDEAKGVAAWLAEDGDARLKLESLRQVGEAVRTYAELETDRAEVEVPAFADMWSRIERRIHANGITERATQPATSAPARKRPGALASRWAAVRRWFEDHRGHVLTGAISAGVACALMLALGQNDQVVGSGTVAGRDTVVQPTQAKLSQPPEVEDLEVYEGSGTILTIEPEGDDESGAAVIWISSDKEQNMEGPL